MRRSSTEWMDGWMHLLFAIKGHGNDQFQSLSEEDHGDGIVTVTAIRLL